MSSNSNDLCWLTASELGRLYRSGELSPVEVAEAYLARIEAIDQVDREAPLGRAFITVTADRARADAVAAEKAFLAGDPGPLAGVPLALKDLCETAGIVTTAGSKSLAARVPERSCTVARRLAAAGTVLLGKTNMVEFAFGPYGFNAHFGIPPNPWDDERVPGGSSSGSGAAVGMGLTCTAIGTDTGGSVRIPSSFCGIVGLKTTMGRVSRAGVTPLSWTLDTVGPMARSVEDAALIYDAMSGPDTEDPVTLAAPVRTGADERTRSVAGMRVGMVRKPFFEGADEEVVRAVEAAAHVLEDAGATIVEMEFPEAVRSIDGAETLTLMQVEGMACHGKTFEEQPENCDPSVLERLGAGTSVAAPDYANVLRYQQAEMRSARETMKDVDAVLGPTMLTPAPRRDELVEAQPRRLTTRAVNWLGLCALTVPCGFTTSQMPIGLQLIGKPFGEGVLLRLGMSYEAATPWHTRRAKERG